MRQLAMFVLLLSAVAAFAQETEAEKLYRAMEKKIRSADSLELTFTADMTDGEKKFAMKGTIQIAADNKTRLDLESELFQLGGKTLIVTNGKAKAAKVGDVIFQEGPFPAKGEVLLALIARFGASMAALEQKIATADLDKDFPLKNFKLGKQEMLGDEETQVIHYQLDDKINGELADVTLWLNPKTNLPLKRTIAGKKGTAVGDTTETYSIFTVNEKLNDKLFVIPVKSE